MSRPPLDSTPLGTSMTNGTTTPSDLIPVRTKFPKHKPLALQTNSPALPTDFTEEISKLNVTGDPDPDSSLSYSSRKYN